MKALSFSSDNTNTSSNSHDISYSNIPSLITPSLIAATGEEIRFEYLAEQKKVAAYLVSSPELHGHDHPGNHDKHNNEVLHLVKSQDMPKELLNIDTSELLQSFLANAYAKVAILDNGDVKLYLYQRGVGGGKKENAALLAAARDGKAEEVKELLTKGADIAAKDNNGRTSLHLAAASGKVSTVTLLLSLGNINVNARDNNGDAALHRAAFNGQLKPLELLINKGADLSLKNNKGQTIIDLAKSGNKQETIKYLEARVIKHEKESASKEIKSPSDTDQSKKSKDGNADNAAQKEEVREEEGLASEETKADSETSNIVQTTTSSTSSSSIPQTSSLLPITSPTSTTSPIPTASTTLSPSTHTSSLSSELLPLGIRLKALYKAQDTLPKLIEDASVPEQKMDDYYVKLQIVMKDKESGQEKHPIVLSQMFEQVENQEAVGKVLVTGVAGIGKTSLLSHISYEWSKGKAFSDKFEYVLKVRLKSLLDEGLANELQNYPKEDRLAAFIQRSIEQQQNEIRSSITDIIDSGSGGSSRAGNSSSNTGSNNNSNALAIASLPDNKLLALSSFNLEEIKNIDKSKTVLLLDGYDEVEHLNRGGHVARHLINEIFKYPNLVLTSRPNAVTSVMEDRLERKIEAIGLEQDGILQYIDRYFAKQAEWLSQEVERANKLSPKDFADIESIIGYYEGKGDSASKDIVVSLEAVEGQAGLHLLETPQQIKQAIASYYTGLKDKLLELYHRNPTLKDTLVTPINLAMICLISTDNEVLREFSGNFNAGKLHESVVYWLGKKYLSKFEKTDPVDINKQKVLARNELKTLEKTANDKFSINKVIIEGRDIEETANRIDQTLGIRQVNKYGLLRPELTKTTYNLEILARNQLENIKSEHSANLKEIKAKPFTIYLGFRQDDTLGYALLTRDGKIEINDLTHIDKQGSIKTALKQQKVRSLDKLPNNNDTKELMKFFSGKGYSISQEGAKDPESHDLINRDHRFIHLSFQEYLTAINLTSQLKSNDQLQLTKVATFIAEHKNEPRYLMTLKFMAGIISNYQSEDRDPKQKEEAEKLLVTRFWEAVTCNLDGALELGLETKVTLLMHLLEQSRIDPNKDGKAELDKRIPNLQVMQKLIDDIVLKDITKWGDAIIASGYVSKKINDKLLQIIKEADAKDTIQDTTNEQELKASIEIVTSLAVKKGLMSKEETVKLLSSFIASSNWQIQNLALEKAAELVDTAISKELLEKITDQTLPLVTNPNSEAHAGLLLTKIVCANIGLYSVISNHLIAIITNTGWKDEYIKKDVTKILRKIVEAETNIAGGVIEALEVAILDKKIHRVAKKVVAYPLGEVVKAEPKIATETCAFLKSVIIAKETHRFAKEAALCSLNEVVKAEPKIATETFKFLKALILSEEAESNIKEVAISSLKEVVKVEPKAATEAVKVLKVLILDEKIENSAKSTIAHCLEEVVNSSNAVKAEPKIIAETAKAIEALTTLILDEKVDNDTKQRVSYSIKRIIEAQPKVAYEAFKILKTIILNRNADSNAKKAAAEFLSIIVKVEPNKAEEAFKVLTTVILDEKADSIAKETAVYSLKEIVRAASKISEEVFVFLRSMILDEKVDSNAKKAVAETLSGVIEAKPKISEEVFVFLRSMILDEKVYGGAKPAAIYSLRAIVRAEPKTTAEVMEVLKAIILDEKDSNDVKHAAAAALREIVKVEPKAATEAVKVLKSLILDEKDNKYAKRVASESLRIVVEVAPEVAGEVLEVLEAVILNEKAHKFAKHAAIYSLKEVIEAKPKLALKVVKILTTLIQDEKADSDIKNAIATVLGKAVKAEPKVAEEIFEILKAIILDEKTNIYTKQAAAESLGEAIKAEPKTAEEVFKVLTTVILDEKADSIAKQAATESLGEAIKAEPNTAEEAFKVLTTVILDKKVEDYVKFAATESLGEAIKAIPLDKTYILLNSPVLQIREATVKGITAKFHSAEEVTKMDYKEIFGILGIISLSKALGEEEPFQALWNTSINACKELSIRISKDAQGTGWLCEYFERFPNSPESTSCLKEFYSQMLSDGEITKTEKDFLIKCIKEKGFTSTIMPEANKIVFDGVTYDITVESASILQEIAQAVIESSSDSLTDQYRNHNPLFKNSGSCLPVASSDVKDYSIVQAPGKIPAELSSNSWQMSVMHLSDHHEPPTFPKKVFILLETRDYAGRHIIHKIMPSSEKGNLVLKTYAFVPKGITTGKTITSEVRKEIFGEMKYEEGARPRYYGSEHNISKLEAENLLKAIKEPEKEDSLVNISEYEAIRELLSSKDVLSTDTTKSLLLPWEDYAEANKVPFETDKLLDLSEFDRRFKKNESNLIITKEAQEAINRGIDKRMKNTEEAIKDLKKEATDSFKELWTQVKDNASGKEWRELKPKMLELELAVNKLIENKNMTKEQLEVVVEKVKKLQQSNDLNTNSVSLIYKELDDMEQKLQGNESSKVFMISNIRYDNELLNHPSLLTATSKAVGYERAMELGKYLSPSLIIEAAASSDLELLLAGAASLSFDAGFS